VTAEVALMNKQAVALAADSAVTVVGSRGNKIYNAANKLFALSKWEPVGVMVYGGAEYMGIPWETVLKIYREQLAKTSFPHVEDYFNDLMKFLGENDELFGDDAQTANVLQLAMRIFNNMKGEIRARIDALIRADPSKKPGAPEITALVKDVIAENHSKVAKKELGFEMDEVHETSVRERYKDTIDEARTTVFEELPLEDSDEELLRDAVVFSLTRNTFMPDAPGVVVAGFGNRDHFPALCSAIVHGRVAGKLKREETDLYEIENENASIVVPFAQIDAVQLFVEGIDPSHIRFAMKLMAKKLDGFMHDILDALEMNDSDKAKSAGEWDKLARKCVEDFSEEARQARIRNYVLPLLDVIAVLPKDELAAVAEALVNITSLRRKVSMDAETVGGPIDVAVISKGDGLVWIHRKHYFRSELNPQFLERYFAT